MMVKMRKMRKRKEEMDLEEEELGQESGLEEVGLAWERTSAHSRW